MWENNDGYFVREDILKKLKNAVEEKAKECNIEIRLLGGLLKFTPTNVYNEVFLELEQPDFKNVSVIYKHGSSQLTSDHKGKAVSEKWVVGFLQHYWLRMMPIIQSPSQLVEVYGKDAAQTFTTNHALNIIFPPKASENHTVLEFDKSPAFLSVKDEKGNAVDYERVGRYCRLNRRLDAFTTVVNGRSITFKGEPTTQTHVFSAPIAAPLIASPNEPEKLIAIETTPASYKNAEINALLELAKRQLEVIRLNIEIANKNPKTNRDQLAEINTRLNDIENRLNKYNSAIVFVTFPRYSTAFNPGSEVATVLIQSAKTADRINISGHTDARVAGPRDAKIALGRALAARNFLVNNGVVAEKINVFSQADAGFIAPNITKGRALNRRVEIEFFG